MVRDMGTICTFNIYVMGFVLHANTQEDIKKTVVTVLLILYLQH